MKKGFYAGILGIGAGSALWMRVYLGLFASHIQVALNLASGVVVGIVAFVFLLVGVICLFKSAGIIPSKITEKHSK